MEPTTTSLAIFGAAWINRDVILKLLGPTADYLGEGMKDLVEARMTNIRNIFDAAAAKSTADLDAEGAVPPRVLKGIIDDGSYCDDSLTSQYFGGLLASSRSGISRDDRAVGLIALLNTLSAYQIRTHYIFYRIFKDLYSGQDLKIGTEGERLELAVFIPLDVYTEALALEPNERAQFGQIQSHALWGLTNSSLIQTMVYGHEEFIKGHFSAATGPGLIIAPSSFGIELFLWAHGRGDIAPDEFLNSEVEIEPENDVVINPGSVKAPLT